MSALPSSPSSWWKRGLAVISLRFKIERFAYHFAGGKFDKAEAYARQVLSYAESHFLPDHRQVLQCRQNLANVLSKRQNYAGAAEQTRLIAEAHERVAGPTGSALAIWLNYGTLQFHKGDLMGADETYRSVIHTLTQAGQRDRIECLNARYLLSAIVLESLGECDEARETMRDVFRGYRAKYGALHFQTLDAGFRLALQEAERAYSGKALAELRDFVPVFKNQFGMDDPRYAFVWHLFGHALYTVGRSVEAEETLRDLHGYAFAETLLSPSSYHQVGALICQALLDQGRYEDAEAFATVELHRLDPEDPNRYSLFPPLAIAFRKNGGVKEAETLLRDALNQVSQNHGADSRATLAWRRELSDHFKDLKSPESVELARANLAIEVKHFGPESCNALTQRNLLVYCLIETGLLAEAVDEARATCEAYQRHGRIRHPMAIGARETLALALTRAGRPAEAEPIFCEILSGFEAGVGLEHRWCLETRLHFAEALRDLGKTTEAKEHAQQALTILVKLRGDKAPDVLKAQRILQSTSQ